MQETKLKTSKLVNIVNKKKSITFFFSFFLRLMQNLQNPPCFSYRIQRNQIFYYWIQYYDQREENVILSLIHCVTDVIFLK